MIPSRRTVLPGAHGNDAAPTFNLRLSNIYQKWELHFIQIRTKFWKQRIYFPNIKSVSVIIYLYVWKVKRSYGVSWLYLDSIDKVGFALKTLFMKLHTSVYPWSEEDSCYFGDKGQVQTWSLNFASFQHSLSTIFC